MSEEEYNMNDNDLDFSTYYKSLTADHRLDEEYIINKSIEGGVIPIEVRYIVMRGVYRGVVKSSNNMLYYFHYVQDNDSFRLVKADDPFKISEANKILDTCKLGCSLIKAGEAGGALGQTTGGQSTINEEVDIDQQDDLLTDKHPAAAITTTPDRPDRGRMWHEEEVPVMAKSWNAGSLLESLNTNLRKSTDNLRPPVSPKEQQFMLEVMGKTPAQIQGGDTYMGPSHKVLYQQWLGKSMMDRVSILDKWTKK